MANKYLGEVSIHLDRVRSLKFDMNAYAEFQSTMGIAIDTIFRKAGKAVDDVALDEDKAIAFKEAMGDQYLRALVWAGLLHEEENLTLREAGKLMCFAQPAGAPIPISQSAQYGYIFRCVMDAWYLSKGKSPKEIADEATKAIEDAAKKKEASESVEASSATPAISTGGPSSNSLETSGSIPPSRGA